MLALILDAFFVLLTSLGWAAVVIIIGWPFRKFVPYFDDIKFDLLLLLILFFVEPLLLQSSGFALRYYETWFYLPFAAATLFYIHKV